MRGLTFEEYGKIIAFAQKHHKFGWIPEEDTIPKLGNLHIKYIDCTYDTRDCQIWIVKFRDGNSNLRFSCNDVPSEEYFKYTNLFDWIMATLKGEWTNRRLIEKHCTIKNDKE